MILFKTIWHFVTIYLGHKGAANDESCLKSDGRGLM